MPELPEVETIAKQLNDILPGKTIASVEVLREKSFRGDEIQLMGKMVKRIKRKQKIIVFELSENFVMLVHLKMTGQLIFVPSDLSLVPSKTLVINHQAPSTRITGGHPTSDWVNELPSKHTRVIVFFTDGSTLYFNDQRVFGWMKLITNYQFSIFKKSLPPDVVDEAFSVEYLKKVLQRSTRAIKLVILDQAKIGGMGNIYACDALYLAKINPNIPSDQLKSNAVIKLHKAMKRVIAKGIETGGATISHYVHTQGLGGHYQDHMLVYGKDGEKCPVCKSVIQKTVIGGRGTYFCPKCQR